MTATPLGPPANLRATAGDGQVTLRWDDPSPKNETIAKWQYCRKPAGAASCEADAWQTEASASARQAVVSDLKHGQAHEFEVRAVNTADQAGPAAAAAAVLHEVTFNSTGYVLIEGGEPLAGQPGRDRVEVMVLLTPAPPSAPGVAIPLTVGGGTAAEDDYEVGPPAFNSSRVLTFPRNQTSRSFTLSVKADADTIHETVLLGFGDLGYGAASATVEAVPSGLRVTGYNSTRFSTPREGASWPMKTAAPGSSRAKDQGWAWTPASDPLPPLEASGRCRARWTGRRRRPGLLEYTDQMVTAPAPVTRPGGTLPRPDPKNRRDNPCAPTRNA